MSAIFFESFQTARFDYHCDRCHRTIEAGEEYQRWLWKAGPNTMHVMREHVDCEPDPPPHEEGRATLYDEYVLPLAA